MRDLCELLINTAQGPMFTLGRNEGVDLGFANEKSISRKHCEISISGSGSSLVVKDLNSRFGTFINDRRLVPGETVTCKESEKMVVKLGVASWKLVLSKRSYKFCSTRLEKSERERLKVSEFQLEAASILYYILRRNCVKYWVPRIFNRLKVSHI